jgi:hypothetical protein
MRFVQGRKVREIADRLAISESDLYRKQRVAIGQLARVLSEMEQTNAAESLAAPTLSGRSAIVASDTPGDKNATSAEKLTAT